VSESIKGFIYSDNVQEIVSIMNRIAMNRIAGVNKSASHYIICCEIVIQMPRFGNWAKSLP